MKLIIDIPDNVYEMVMNTGTFGIYRFNTAKAIKNGIPLDDVKTEIDQYLFQNEFGLEYRKEVLQILDNIGKAESEDFPQAKDIEPTVKGFVDTMDILDRICEESEE